MIVYEWCGSWVVNDGFGMVFVTSRSDITNLSNKIKKYYENLIYYTSLPKNAGNFKTFIIRKLSKKSIIYETPI